MPAALRGLRDGQRATGGPNGAVQRQLAEQRHTLEACWRQLPAGGEHRACKR